MPIAVPNPELVRVDQAVRTAVDAAVPAALAEDADARHANGTPLRRGRFVLAVSGGRDSMCMLHAFARVAPHAVAAVATFDHGTGPHAAQALQLVADACGELGLRCVSAVATTVATTEAAWRDARWRFLRAVARRERATIATAHTRDDNLETILIRVLRGSGARGLAALFADGDVVRPFLGLSRDDVAAAARADGVQWIEDPSNASRAHLRNRVRHDLLPALSRARPSIADELLDINRRAAIIRLWLDSHAETLVASGGSDGSLSVATAPLADYDPEVLRALWPAIAAQGGVVLDRRGTDGLARFTKESATGDRMQLSGGIEVLRQRDAIVLGRSPIASPAPAELGPRLTWGRWRFAETSGSPPNGRVNALNDCWSASFATANRLTVRQWRDGDRMQGAGDVAPRRVKRFLRDAGLAGPERTGWPVVVRGEEVVWIPGVRRSDAATVRSGRPEAVYVCERTES